MPEQEESLSTAQVAHKIADIILEKKGLELRVLDISECSDIGDFMVIATGASKRQVQAMAEDIAKELKSAGRTPIGVNGKEVGWWILMDFGDVVVHLMQEDARRYYDLEALWADAPVVRRGVEDAA